MYGSLSGFESFITKAVAVSLGSLGYLWKAVKIIQLIDYNSDLDDVTCHDKT